MWKLSSGRTSNSPAVAGRFESARLRGKKKKEMIVSQVDVPKTIEFTAKQRAQHRAIRELSGSGESRGVDRQRRGSSTPPPRETRCQVRGPVNRKCLGQEEERCHRVSRA